ncbi:ribonuclease Z [Facklamia languida]|uniref:Ribonuclease Z n=1 Tax=Facklamia languida CCUG 37842 TaxID=883113 RepID=H3NKA6_9LACT|nr:ribonuclease Z [Facklamia languida]EHR36623.1 ribonuclease Z [Facklamia languida CCUG 37842]
MQIQFLGTGAGIPAKQRNVSSLTLKLLDELNEVWMFDCGEGTQHHILRTHLKPRKINRIFITHLHGDHIYGLPGLLSSRSFQGGEGPLYLYGPKGIRTFIETAIRISRSKLPYPLIIEELTSQGGHLDIVAGWQVDYLPLDHGILSYGYRVQEPDAPGQLLMDRLAPYQIPNGPILGQLKRGEVVELADGQVLNGQDFLAPPRPGRVVTILGDTRKTANSVQLAKGADVLVHEATHEAGEAKMAKAYFHSTSAQAAQVAQDAQVGQLYMNHISARYLKQETRILEQQAQAIFPASQVVQDFDEFEIPPRGHKIEVTP